MVSRPDLGQSNINYILTIIRPVTVSRAGLGPSKKKILVKKKFFGLKQFFGEKKWF